MCLLEGRVNESIPIRLESQCEWIWVELNNDDNKIGIDRFSLRRKIQTERDREREKRSLIALPSLSHSRFHISFRPISTHRWLCENRCCRLHFHLFYGPSLSWISNEHLRILLGASALMCANIGYFGSAPPPSSMRARPTVFCGRILDNIRLERNNSWPCM